VPAKVSEQDLYRPVQLAVARVARAVQARDLEAERAARHDLATAKFEQSIRKAIAAAPPLTQEQRDRLATLLRGSGDE